MVLPLLTLVWLALFGRGEGWATLASVRPGAAALQTAIMLAGVGLVTGAVGTLAAWLVTFHDFPLRRTLAWALVLPLAVPTYLAAYAQAEFWSYTGPVQEAVRALGGFASPRDYPFPSIRSMGGLVLVLSSVLYPYVYLSVRAMLAAQGPRMSEACRTLGAAPGRAARRVVLPLARPAIAIGILLALMEALNDIGAVEHLGVRTLTRSVFALWINRSDLAAAAQLALVLLAVVLVLVVAERAARGAAGYSARGGEGRPLPPARLRGWRAALAVTACTLPVLAGFGVPLAVFIESAAPRLDRLAEPRMVEAALTSLAIGAATATATALLALLALVLARAEPRRRAASILLRLTTLGYAVPGTVVGLGLFLSLAALDNALDGAARSLFGVSTGLLLSGSALIVVHAHMVRFMTMAEGTLGAGLSRLSPHLEPAARTLGRSEGAALRTVTLPLLTPAILTAMLLVFIESVKELSATLLVRPFGVETLSIAAYELATQGRPEAAAVPALVIVALGFLPVVLVSRATLPEARSRG